MSKDAIKQQEKLLLQIEGKNLDVYAGSSFDEVFTRFEKGSSRCVVGAKYNNKIVGMYEKMWEAGEVEFLDLHSEDGMRIYRQSLVFILAWASNDLYPFYKLKVKHSLGKSYYCEFLDKDSIASLEVKALEARMREIVAAKEIIRPETLEIMKAKEYLEKYNREDTVDLLDSLQWENVTIYNTEKYASFSNTILVPHTGLLDTFLLEPYAKGFLLRFPDEDNPTELAPKYKLPKLAQVWQESEEWASILGVRNLSGLINLFKKSTSEANTLIHVGEALQEKKIASIADEIYSLRDRVELILIAGPSSSGKTTFAERLSIQLRVLGLRPIAISTDDYFLDREHTPRDEYGEYDFEALEAVDLPLFNMHLQEIIKGELVHCPVFNFQRGEREETGKKVYAEEGHPIIVEGIHALNEKLTESIKRENKYKIYISALTQIAIDDHNRLLTTDTRLIRRIVRDNQFRSQNALSTLKRWASVRRGEEKNIFPFQEDADMMFNSALIYELSILKKYAYPLLQVISPEEKEFYVAKRLLDLLEYVPEITDKHVPLNSILREFIGGSSIHGK
ncbi:MAG: AAA family ATPase [Firmicutes bacterium HGW-Firmicutes-12]|nr:MAG: AAA family ATPase [Firmicutes bacterium HGW-Firmicutes-12]